MDPEDVTSPALNALDKAITHNRETHEILITYRAEEYTRTYHRLRMQRIRANAPTTTDQRRRA